MNYKAFILSLLVCCCSFQSHGQEKKSAPSRSISKERNSVNNLLQHAEHTAANDPQKALDYLEEALSISLKEGDKTGEANTYMVLGNLNMKQNLYAQAINFYSKALRIFQEEKNYTQTMSTKKALGQAYEKNKNYTQALEQYQTGLKDAEHYKNEPEIIAFKNHIAHIYKLQGKNDEALTLYKDVLSTEQKQKNKKGEIDAKSNIGDVYIQQQKLETAKEYYQSSQDIAIEEDKDEELINKSYDKIINTYKLEGKATDEIKLRKEKVELNLKNNDEEVLAKEYLELGKIYFSQKKIKEARSYFTQSINLSKKKSLLSSLAEAEKYMSFIEKQTGNYALALEHYQKYVAAKDSILNNQQEQQQTLISFNDELTLKQKQIDLLEKDMRLNETTILLLQEEKKFSTLIIYVLSIGLLIVGLSGWLVYSNAKKRRIASQSLVLRSLRSQMNPHFIFNALNSVNNFISKNDERSANKYLSDFSKLMRTVMENSRHEFISLSTELSILELYLSLEHARFKEKFDYALHVSEEVAKDLVMIPPMLIQPYIENAIWHGLRYKEEKGLLQVDIHQVANELIVSIKDNGIGRKKSMALKTHNQKDKESIGLKNIDARIKIINELYNTNTRVRIEDLNTKDGSGTKVTVYITQTHKIQHEA